jgi:hypothetical protein
LLPLIISAAAAAAAHIIPLRIHISPDTFSNFKEILSGDRRRTKIYPIIYRKIKFKKKIKKKRV